MIKEEIFMGKKGINEKHQMTSIFNGLDELVYVSDPETYEVLFLNQIGVEVFGDFKGRKCHKLFQSLDSPCEFCTNHIIFGEYLGKSYIWEWQNKVNKQWYRCIDKAIPWMDGRMVRFEIAIDVTELKRAEEKLKEQAEEIHELSTPVIQVWEGLVIAPLVGVLDSQRTQAFMERFLDSIVDTRSPVAIVDITGVPTVDTQTSQNLIEAVTAARLLGTKVILTGVRPSIAQTLVQLGIDLSEIDTRASLTSGLSLALSILGLEVTERNKE
jgi:anti-anti-sigma regulatory factor